MKGQSNEAKKMDKRNLQKPVKLSVLELSKMKKKTFHNVKLARCVKTTKKNPQMLFCPVLHILGGFVRTTRNEYALTRMISYLLIFV